MKTGVLFDLDGTLLDTLEDLADSVNNVLGKFGYPLRSLEEIRRFVGNGVGELVRRAVPDGAEPAPVLEAFRSYYADHCREKTAPYEGVMEMLEQLRQEYPLAIVSNKPDFAVKTLCAELFPGVYALGESANCPRKPAADMVWQAMADIGVERCVYIGDSEVDVATAKNAGMKCLSVLWGFRTRQELEQSGGEFFCEKPSEISALIKAALSLDGE